jgi:hypothetical protein
MYLISSDLREEKNPNIIPLFKSKVSLLFAPLLLKSFGYSIDITIGIIS